MTQPFTGLAAALGRYPYCICDVWGVVHNGVAAYPEAVKALTAYRAAGGRTVLLTNAPMPAEAVEARLRSMNVDPGAICERIVTSGQLTEDALRAAAGAVYHWGPAKDLPLYRATGTLLTDNITAAASIVCTGLLPGSTSASDADLLQAAAAANIPMICANPDLHVHVGDRLEACAGTIALQYEAVGGSVVRFGKPFAPAYDRCLELLGRPLLSQVLAVGDGLPTDIQGAEQAGIASLFITGGLHRNRLQPDAASVKALAAEYGLQPNYFAEGLT